MNSVAPSTFFTPAMEPVYSPGLLFILDWDNTLIPSKWLETKGFRLSLYDGGTGSTPEMISVCESIAPHVAALINSAKRYGRVVILTNATKSWVELGCSLFMPSILNLIMSLPMISAADIYGDLFEDPMRWKELAFQREIVDLGVRAIVSIGDGEPERNAALNLGMIRPILVKSLKFMDNPTPEILLKQLEGTVKAMHMLATCETPLDIMWLASEFVTKEDPFDEILNRPLEVTSGDPNLPPKKSAPSSKPARSPTPKPRYDFLDTVE